MMLFFIRTSGQGCVQKKDASVVSHIKAVLAVSGGPHQREREYSFSADAQQELYTLLSLPTVLYK